VVKEIYRCLMKLFTLFFSILITLPLLAQKPIDKQISASYTNFNLTQIFYDLEVKHQVKVYFDIKEAPTFRVTREYKDKQIWSLVKDLLNGTKLVSFSYDDSSIVVMDMKKVNRDEVESLVAKWQDGSMGYPTNDDFEKITKRYGLRRANQGEVTYKIKLQDKLSKEPLVGALVYTDDFAINDVTDEKGICTLRLPAGVHRINITYTSYQTILLSLEIYKSASEVIRMNPSSYLLDEVEIVANSAQAKIEDTKTGVERIDMARVEAIPQALGEPDLIKSLEVLPGVTSAGELSSGFNVRGGKLDASLVLMDDAIVFNPTHVVGFISAFNSDMINNATLYKGFVPAEFGNRSSAVLDISSAKGGQKWKAKGGIGTSMLKLMLEGPISDKTTFAASARGSFSDYLLDMIANNEVQNSSASFYDLNFSMNHRFSDRTSISLSGYASDDYFLYNNDFGFEWQNKFISLVAKHSWSSRLTSRLSVSTGSYSTNQFTVEVSDAFTYRNGINYIKGVLNNTYSIGENSFLKAGVETIRYDLQPEELAPNQAQSVTPTITIRRLGSVAIAPYLSGKIDLLKNVSFEGGIRYTTYSAVGPGRRYEYEGDLVTVGTIIGSEEVQDGEEVSSFSLLEPRVSLGYVFHPDWSLKGSYNRISQNAQLISIANTSIPTDLWIFSNEYIEPRVVDQISLGAFHNTADGKYTFSLEAFSKTINNDFVLKDFPNIISNEHLETEVSEADGESIGIEMYAEKLTGKLTGSLAYTYSRTRFRTTTDRFPVNLGAWTPADIDIPHQLNLVFSYRFAPTFIISGGYTFKTGRPFTIPEGTAIIDDLVVPLYSFRNVSRLPNYSRFDLALTLDLRKSTQSGFRSSFTLGIYNLFGNNNVNNVFFRKSAGGNVRGFQLAVIGAAIPSLSWNFVFD